MIEQLLNDPRWIWFPGMAWVYASDPHKIYRVKGDEIAFRSKGHRGGRYGHTRLPVTSDHATAGCLWQMVSSSVKARHAGWTVELCYGDGHGKYTATLYNESGEPAFESSGDCFGRCALVMLHWLWFHPAKGGNDADL